MHQFTIADLSGPGFGREYRWRPAPAEWEMLAWGKALIPE
jgi:hypothetical protein